MKNENGLINFSKMRMVGSCSSSQIFMKSSASFAIVRKTLFYFLQIAQVVEEIRQYQEIRYNIQHDSRVSCLGIRFFFFNFFFFIVDTAN